jgi:hypothetical protein
MTKAKTTKAIKKAASTNKQLTIDDYRLRSMQAVITLNGDGTFDNDICSALLRQINIASNVCRYLICHHCNDDNRAEADYALFFDSLQDCTDYILRQDEDDVSGCFVLFDLDTRKPLGFDIIRTVRFDT